MRGNLRHPSQPFTLMEAAEFRAPSWNHRPTLMTTDQVCRVLAGAYRLGRRPRKQVKVVSPGFTFQPTPATGDGHLLLSTLTAQGSREAGRSHQGCWVCPSQRLPSPSRTWWGPGSASPPCPSWEQVPAPQLHFYPSCLPRFQLRTGQQVPPERQRTEKARIELWAHLFLGQTRVSRAFTKPPLAALGHPPDQLGVRDPCQ